MTSDRHAIYWQAEIFDRKESNSKVLFLSSTSRCRKRTSRKYKKSNKFILVHHQNIYKSSFHNRSTFHPLRHVKTSRSPLSFSSTFIHQHFIHFHFPHNASMPQEVFPPHILRPRPRPYLPSASTAALASMSRSTAETWPLRAAQCSGVMPREPPKPCRRNPTETDWEKSFEKILGISKRSKLLTKVKHCCF